MAVGRIERIVGGIVVSRVERGSRGSFECHQFGSNVAAIPLPSLGDVADYLHANPRSGVRMNPGWVKISRNIHIDGVLLR